MRPNANSLPPFPFGCSGLDKAGLGVFGLLSVLGDIPARSGLTLT
jgi:hypothetical protein